MLRVLIVLGLLVGIGSAIAVGGDPPQRQAVAQVGIDDQGATADASAVIDATGPSTVDPTTTSMPVDPTTVPPVGVPGVSGATAETPNATTVTPGQGGDSSGAVGTESIGGAFGAELTRAAGAGVPGATDALVLASACRGDGGRSHWGYFNNGAAGGTVYEPDGAVVPVGAICLNPGQPDPYSSLIHELGHRWFWNSNLWITTATQFGSTERAAECFARVFGATVFGAGGCPDSMVPMMESDLGR